MGKNQSWKRPCVLVLVVLLLIMAATAIGPQTSYAEAVDLNCTPLSGGNAGSQNYGTWSSTVSSYLVKDSAGYMRVQADVSGMGVVACYYDADFQLVSRTVLPTELPIFGGFYESEDNYFIVTGQSNPDESDAVEVYRITKYDKNWNRIGSCGLYGANTVYPFDAGSCRMDMDGAYLLIRTCHKMYASDDGYNHQANVTIEVDTSTMAVTDSYYGVMNTSYGYVSHSFNQFIQIEDHHIISVDHGDAYPRAICLMIYPTDVSSGSFRSTKVQTVNVLTLAGSTGANATGASVGGFASSSSSWLVAGNSIPQDGASHSTRNVFVHAVDKSTKSVSEHWLTSYADGETSVSTPHLVQISSDAFAVLWTRGGKVQYAFVDGTGALTSQIYEMDGSLSDCAPIIDQGNITWYVWKNGEETFYRISAQDPTDTTTTVQNYDHTYEWLGTQNGIIQLQCSKCGEKTEGRAPTSFWAYWRKAGASGYYYYSVPSDIEEGEAVEYMLSDLSYPEGEQTIYDEMVGESNDPEHCIVDTEREEITFTKIGDYTVKLYPKYNPEVSRTYTFKVRKTLEAVTLHMSAEMAPYGSSVTLTAIPDGGKGTIAYTFTVTDENGTKTVLASDVDKNTFDFVPEQTGTYQLQVQATDKYDNTTVQSDQIELVVVKAPVHSQEGQDVTANESLVYGQQLTDLSLAVPKFIASNTGKTVEGQLEIVDAERVLPVGNHIISWIFTPTNANYETAEGVVEISVIRAVPSITQQPETAPQAYEPKLTLAQFDLSGSASVPGTWTWKDPAVSVVVPGGTFTAVFTPDDTGNYQSIETEAAVVVTKAFPVIAETSASAIVYGQALADSSIDGQVYYNEKQETVMSGTFVWRDPTAAPTAGEHTFDAVFIPTDPSNCEQMDCTVQIYVEKAEHPAVLPPESISVPYRTEALTQEIMPTSDWQFLEDDIGAALEAGAAQSFTAIYVGEDQENYKNTMAQVQVMRSTCEHDGDKEIRGAKEATCTEEGATGDTVCLICGEVILTSRPIQMLPHAWDSGSMILEPTCVSTGEKIYTCADCGKTRTEIVAVDPSNHLHVTVVGMVPATDQADGHTEGRTCDDCGTVLAAETVIPRITDVQISAPAYTYDGKEKYAAVTILAGDQVLEEGIDYAVQYTNNIKAGTATVMVEMQARYQGSYTEYFNIAPRSIKNAVVTGIKDMTYTGKSLTQKKLKVVVNGITLKANTDYTVKYASNKAAGKATITISGKGNYTGSIKKTFKIKPKQTSIVSVKNTSTKMLTVKWNKAASGTGYEIQYSTKSSFSGAKTKTVKSLKTVSLKLTKLTKGKTYYVRVRVYKIIDGKRVYSTWSKVKKAAVTK